MKHIGYSLTVKRATQPEIFARKPIFTTESMNPLHHAENKDKMILAYGMAVYRIAKAEESEEYAIHCNIISVGRKVLEIRSKCNISLTEAIFQVAYETMK